MLGAYVTRTTFSTTVRERTSFNELLNFFKKQFRRPPTVICLIKRAADNLINFQAVVKKRLGSEFELLKCCRIFKQRSDRLRTLQGAAQISRNQSGHLRLSNKLWYCIIVLIICALGFSTNAYPCRIFLGYFAISGENVSRKTRHGHKRSSGRKRYPSPGLTSVAISCCTSSKGQPFLKEQHASRASSTCML